jgi:uncharacterized membrane protein
MDDLGALDGDSAAPLSINNRGQVIGLTTFRGQSVSFIWTRQEGMRVIPLPPSSTAVAINDRGDIAYNRRTPQGVMAFVWSGQQEIALPTYHGHQSEVAALNGQGILVGHSWRANHGHVVMWMI